HLELVAGGLADHQRPLAGEDRQVLAAPAPPLGADLVRLGELDEVADRPGDHPAVAVEIAVALALGPQGAGEVAGHGRLLGDDRGAAGAGGDSGAAGAAGGLGAGGGLAWIRSRHVKTWKSGKSYRKESIAGRHPPPWPHAPLA